MIATVLQFHHSCRLKKAHHKTIYEGKVMCIKDELNREDTFLLGHGNNPSVGFIAQFSSYIVKLVRSKSYRSRLLFLI